MRISTWTLLGYFLVVGLAAYFVLSVFMQEVKPGVRQAMEDSLVDTANVLAELAATDFKAGRIAEGSFAQAVRAYSIRDVKASIWGMARSKPDYRIYITDAKGIVVFDSSGSAIGENYARWNDVHLTLQGRYGVRSTKSDPNDEASTVMHVAAPIKDGERMVGVLTVAKPNSTVQPFIERAQNKIRERGIVLLIAAALIGVFFTWRLTRSITRLRIYARDVSSGKRAQLPASNNSEIAELGRSLEAMREKLEGKQYVEEYVHTLTHEMKSPVAAIQGAAELLAEDLPNQERQRFTENIREQANRLHMISEKMLSLATLEHRRALQEPTVIEVGGLIQKVLDGLDSRFASRQIKISLQGDAGAVFGERFLLEQALTNLIENAIDFSPVHGQIDVSVKVQERRCEINVADRGPGVPDFARDRVFERFYSLPRPDTGKKSTGLGLALVREVATLHGGAAVLENRVDGGAIARLILPLR
ncbi:MAG TPA: two-component system sensor histidine kinase CreC [Burkholderiales bacterium]|nr:two-component system sensor histidine kinase CreC [Burkholderiales bacterium]